MNISVTVGDLIAAGLSAPSLHLNVTVTSLFPSACRTIWGRTIEAKYELPSRSHALALTAQTDDEETVRR